MLFSCAPGLGLLPGVCVAGAHLATSGHSAGSAQGSLLAVPVQGAGLARTAVGCTGQAPTPQSSLAAPQFDVFTGFVLGSLRFYYWLFAEELHLLGFRGPCGVPSTELGLALCRVCPSLLLRPMRLLAYAGSGSAMQTLYSLPFPRRHRGVRRRILSFYIVTGYSARFTSPPHTPPCYPTIGGCSV